MEKNKTVQAERACCNLLRIQIGWSGKILLSFNKRVKKQTVDIWIKSIPGRGNSKCKGLEVGG